MNPYYRLSLMICRLVGSCLLVIGILDVGLYWLKSKHDDTPLSIGRCVWLSVPLVIGMAVLIKSGALAQRMADYLED